jgi:hypothetical protein
MRSAFENEHWYVVEVRRSWGWWGDGGGRMARGDGGWGMKSLAVLADVSDGHQLPRVDCKII